LVCRFLSLAKDNLEKQVPYGLGNTLVLKSLNIGGKNIVEKRK